MPSHLTPIHASSVAHAWSQALIELVDNPGTWIAPLTFSISISNQILPADLRLQASLDQCLTTTDNLDTEQVAFAIFPNSVWQTSGGDRHRFYERYLRALPRYVALAPSRNGRGMYFARMVGFGIDPKTCQQLPHINAARNNQLEYIISEYTRRQRVRASMLQVAIFDPVRDHTPAAQLGFPCLQHLTFVPGPNRSLALNAFYATQQMFKKAYGNLLGLSRLGAFVADQMDRTFDALYCHVGIEKLEGIGKTNPRLRPVIEAARECVAAHETV